MDFTSIAMLVVAGAGALGGGTAGVWKVSELLISKFFDRSSQREKTQLEREKLGSDDYNAFVDRMNATLDRYQTNERLQADRLELLQAKNEKLIELNAELRAQVRTLTHEVAALSERIKILSLQINTIPNT